MAATVDAEKPEVDSGCDDGLGPPWKIWRRRRYIVAVFAFFGFFNVYSLRVNLSVAVVAMNSYYNVTLPNGTVVEVRDFDWDSKQVGLALSSFFYGYIWTQVMGGWISSRFGGNNVYCWGIAVTAVLTLITPIATKQSFALLIAIRIIEGFFEGVTFPCIHAVWAEWAPPLERSKLASIAFSGSYIGTVIVMPLTGVISNKLGWEASFYIFGVIAIIWCAAWTLVVQRSPRLDRHITRQELEYIEKSMGPSHQSNLGLQRPWLAIVTSKAVWAIVVSHVAENWGFYTLLTQLPSFMHDTLNFKLEKAGFLSGLPYLVMGFVLLGSGQLADWLRYKQILSTTMVRKLFNCGAFIVQTIFMLLAAHLQSPEAIVACLVVAVGTGGFAWSGFAVNHLDIAPQHAGILMGFGNTFATLPGIISPLITGYIVVDHSPEQWRIVFYIASFIYLIGAIVYGICASGEVQPWAKPKIPVESNGHHNKALEVDQ